MQPPQGKFKIISLKEWVPQSFGLVMFLLFGFAFQFSMSAYLQNLEEVTMAKQLSREDVRLAFQVSLIGMAVVFPLLFRLKFRFKAKYLLLTAIVGVMVFSFISAITSNIVILVIASFFLGVFRMMGTFESLSAIQLFITPKRDMGVWFTFVYTLVLVSIQGSGVVSTIWGHHFSWETMYYLMLGIHIIMLILILTLLRPIHFMEPVPFRSIDWRGLSLWALLFTGISYLMIYGHTKDWLNSAEIRVALLFTTVVLLMLIFSYKAVRKPFIFAEVFTMRSVVVSSVIIFFMEFFINTGGGIIHPFEEGIMGLDSLHMIQLNILTLIGILVASVFCFYWFFKINASYKILFAGGFSALLLYHLLIGNVLSSSASLQHLYIPYFFKGIGYLTIYAGVGKYMMQDVSFETFPMGWFIVAIVRNAVGAPVVSTMISEWHHHQTMNYLDKLATNIQIHSGSLYQMFNGISFGTRMQGASWQQSLQAASGALYGKAYLQSSLLAARDLYAWVTLLGIVILVGILMYHFSKPILKSRFGDRFWKA